jgi:hypothetical protein
MKFSIKFNGDNIEVEAENVVQAIQKIIKLMDISCDMKNNIEFDIAKIRDCN